MKDSKHFTNTQSHKPTMSRVYCGHRDTTRLFTGTNLRYVRLTENVSSQTAVYVHFTTPVMEHSSESYWLDCTATLNLALTDKTSCRLQFSSKITYFSVAVGKKST
jgi:hypothetical protein